MQILHECLPTMDEDEQEIVSAIEQRLRKYAKYLTIDCGKGVPLSSVININNYSINNENIKCKIVNYSLHGSAYGNFIKSGRKIKCNFDNGKLIGAIRVRWQGAYIDNTKIKNTSTSTYVEGVFDIDGLFTGKCIRKGRFFGGKHYVKNKVVYEYGMWHYKDKPHQMLMSGPCLLNDAPLGSSEIYYNNDGRVDYSRSWQKDDKGRDLCILPGEVFVYKLGRIITAMRVIYCYIELLITADVKRIPFIPFTSKTRVEKAYVTQIFDKDGNKYTSAESFVHIMGFKYNVGVWAIPDAFDDNENHPCSLGISVYQYIDDCNQWLPY